MFSIQQLFQLILWGGAALSVGMLLLARAGLPVVLTMEGGYAVEAIGRNAVGVLAGFEAA